MAQLDQILDNFAYLDDWEDRYRYVIELGKALPDLPEDKKTAQNKVQGCASQVWIETRLEHPGGRPTLHLVGDSDAHIVRGLVALMIALYGGKTPEEALSTDALALFTELGLAEHLTPQRSNGVRSMVERIRRDAQAAQATL